MFKLNRSLAGLFISAFLLFPVDARAQEPPKSDKVPVTTLITVLGPKFSAPPALGRADVIVRTGDHRENVTGWVPARGQKATLQLAILIDDGASDFNVHLDEVRHFIQSQPKGANVGVFYASMGQTLPVVPFSPDHDAVAKKVRITVGRDAISTSIYLSLIDVLNKLQSLPGRREVLLIADGHDRLRGDLPESPDLDRAMDAALRDEVVVHTLYASVGRLNPASFSLTLAQSNLNHIAAETGGQAFFQGLETPVSFTPFLDQLDMVLHNQYFLTFTVARGPKEKGEFRSFKVTTEQRNAQVTAPARVFVPGPSK